MTQTPLNRNAEIRQIHREYEGFYQLGGGILLVIFGVVIGAMLFSSDSGYGTNIYTEILSVGLTILVLNQLQDRRDKHNREQDLKAQLIYEAGSRSHDTAIRAVEIIRKRGWLKGKKSILQYADLRYANLKRAIFGMSNLKGIILWHANLVRVDLAGSDLTEAKLAGVNLYGADLRGVNLSGAILSGASLVGADLRSAKLEGADLYNANLLDVVFDSANLKGIVLPDAQVIDWNNQRNPIYDKYWTPDTDMRRYTDPSHPDFWQPDWAKNSQEE